MSDTLDVKPPHPALIIAASDDISPPVGRARIGRPVSLCCRCRTMLSADERRYYGDHCNVCAGKESDALTEAAKHPTPGAEAGR
jgi:hypothetical protein